MLNESLHFFITKKKKSTFLVVNNFSNKIATSDNKKRSNCRGIGAGPTASMRFAFSYPLLSPRVGEGKKFIASPDVHNTVPLLAPKRISQFLE